jgi:HSP20 family molecular chaperone IbpA
MVTTSYSYMTDPFAMISREINQIMGSSSKTTYPPYNIIRLNEDSYVIDFAVAGFKKDHIEITTEKDMLVIKGDKEEETLAEGAAYAHKGIAGRKFTKSFSLPEYFEVRGGIHGGWNSSSVFGKGNPGRKKTQAN